MQRYGSSESHHYIVGVYTTIEQAKLAGEAERSYRGGKYEPLVQEFVLDEPIPTTVLVYHQECL